MTWANPPGRRRGLPPTTKQRIHHRDAGTCYLCGHAGGQMHLDHVINHKTWTDQARAGSPDQDGNLALAHATPCPTCGASCHTDKTQREARDGSNTMRARTTRPRPPHPGLR